MYVYKKSESQLWTVGFYDPTGKWNPESDHDNTEDAAERVSLLNGNRASRSKEEQVITGGTQLKLQFPEY